VCRRDGRLSGVERAKSRPPCGEFISESNESQQKTGGSGSWDREGARFRRLVLAEELFAVLDEADETTTADPAKADKKHHFQQPHCKDCKLAYIRL
jgi:hypothetical protein